MRALLLSTLSTFLLLSACVRGGDETTTRRTETATVNSQTGEDAPAPENSPAPDATAPRGSSAEAKRPRGEPDDERHAPEKFEGTKGATKVKRDGRAPALLREVRSARHEGFDRVVFEFDGEALPGYRVEYVERPVRQCGSGRAVSLAGDARLRVSLRPAHAHDKRGEPTVAERSRRVALTNLIELKLVCDFEAEVEWALGLSSAGRYRVLELREPARIVLDVEH